MINKLKYFPYKYTAKKMKPTDILMGNGKRDVTPFKN